MKNPLLTHFLGRFGEYGRVSILTSLLLLVLLSQKMTAQVITKTECYCLNNATTPTNGQYLDTITITGAPGQTWKLMTSSSTNFYNVASLPPPAAPVLYFGEPKINETVPGVSGIYRIVGKRVSGQSWSVNVKHMNTNQVYNVVSSQSCTYPNFVITGDEDVCRSSSESYSIPATGIYSNLVWTLTGGGAFVPAPTATSNAVNVNWGPTAGRYSLGVSGVHRSFSTQSQGCSFDVSKIVDVEDISRITSIKGDPGNCIGSTEIYSIDAPVSLLTGVVWTITTVSGTPIPSPVNPVGGEPINQRTITFPGVGVYTLQVVGNYTLTNGPGVADDNTCPFTNTMTITVVNEGTPPMACQGLVNISMNPDCELYFQASQFLEAKMFSDTSYDIIIKDLSTNTVIPQGSLGYAYVGKTLEIKVVHECSGNSCWGYARIEDKSIPELICPTDKTIECDDIDSLNITGFPTIPVGAVRTPIAGKLNTWRVTGYDKCSDVTISFTDASITSCTGSFSTVITRSWSVIDNSGNSSSCTQVISVLRASLLDVVFPGNYDDIVGLYPALDACGNWKKVPYVLNGKIQPDSVPSPEHTGAPSGVQCLKAHVTYTDRKLLICDNNEETYKLFRKWTVFDHCVGRDTSYTQLIAVMDKQPPQITCPADSKLQPVGSSIVPAEVVYTSPYSCVADWAVLPPQVIYECSGYTWDVDFLLAGSNGLPPVDGSYTKSDGSVVVMGTKPAFSKSINPSAKPFTIKNLPKGLTWIRYTVTDKCGNFTYCFTEVEVRDGQPPVPVCDKNSVVAISNSTISGTGVGIAGVFTFDDGSHDNCGIKCMKIRRMDQPTNWNSLPCDNKLTFTCADVNKSIMVELGVWDVDDSFNSCMVEAKIQDNIAPIVNAPDDKTISCKAELENLSVHGSATYFDNCNITIDSSVVRQLDECNIGTIKRFFRARDTYGNMTIDSQVITVRNLNPIVHNDINWPGTITRSNVCLARTSPKDLNSEPSVFSSVNATKCHRVAFHHDDVEFKFSDGVCRKILRTWTAIDWCNNGQRFSQTQLIMITNDIPPDIVYGCHPDSLKITPEGTCQARVEITARATETRTGDCVSNQLVWWYDLDQGNDGSIEFRNVSGNVFNRLLNYGTHKLTWYVKDDCGNVGTCSNIFTLRDTKKPTPVCNSELVTVIMPSSREVAIWASDFLTNSTFDNCTPFAQIKASFSGTNVNDISRTIRCIDLNGAPFKDTSFNVYAIDAAGNSDFCTVRLRVQSNNNSCAPRLETVGLRGSIYSESSEMVQNVNVSLMSDQAEFPKSVMTGNNGKWTLDGLKMYKDYTIAADKNDDILNGVSTLDLVMIQKHILGIQSLESPYKLIAADVNNSQKITAADLTELRKVILGINSTFTNNKSWRFVDVAHQFKDPKNPFPFIEQLSMSKVDHDVAGLDFFAIKIGDVNGSAKKNTLSDNNTEARTALSLYANKVTALKGEVVTVHIRANDLNNLLGLQMTLGVDYKLAELINIKSDKLQIKDENLGMRNLSDGQIHISWNNQSPINVNDDILQVTFKALQDIKDKNILHIESTHMSPELYLSEGNGIQTSKIVLQSLGSSSVQPDQFELFQNVPNPFNATTIIGFNLPKADEVTLKIFDLTGKMIYNSKGNFSKGYNIISIDANELNLNGVLYYQIEADGHAATKKMIIIK